MKLALIALTALPLVATADVRLELRAPGQNGAGGSIVHAPYDQRDADQEFKFNPGDDKIVSNQLPSGNYNVEYTTTFKKLRKSSVRTFDLPQVDVGGKDTVDINCAATQGVFVDDQGNTFTTNDCEVQWVVKRTPRRGEYSATLDMRLYNATQATGASLEEAEEAGLPIVVRPAYLAEKAKR